MFEFTRESFIFSHYSNIFYFQEIKMSGSFKSLPINADRICEAISKIGYNPVSAILDIVDNSFVACSKQITIKLFMKDGTTVNNPKNIEKIVIIDNGRGMDSSGIQKALELGSDVSYGQNSLSKYGLGLKSAGFSLGRRIEVVSKIDQKPLSQKYFLDRDLIRKEGSFGYSIEDANAAQKEYLKDYNSGTVISISQLIYTSRISASKIMEDLANKAGVNYCEFLKDKEVVFKIQIINGANENVVKEKIIKPKDILFWGEAYDSFEIENYDGKRPCKVLDSSFENPLNVSGEKIKIQVSIFPKDSMKTYPLFSSEEQKKIKDFDVSLKNSGFYFYRNGRLIKWGEKLFLNREFGIRIKISFTTGHDELFDVDVSKQHLTVSEDVESILKTLLTHPLHQSKQLFEICDGFIKSSKNQGQEGSEFNAVNSTLEEDDDETINVTTNEINQRKDLIVTQSEQLDRDGPKYEDEENHEVFRRVRYWMGKRNIWDAGLDRVEGSYVLINKLHPFYDLALQNLEIGSPQRQIIEAVFFAHAVGRNQVVQKFGEANGELVVKIMDAFQRYTSTQLDNWVNNNWDIFEDDN